MIREDALTAQWTPGPWALASSDDPIRNRGAGLVIVAPARVRPNKGRKVGEASLAYRSSHEAFANARLIAAAPDLYRALEWCVDTLKTRNPDGLALYPEWSLAHSALSKARGEDG